MTYIQKGKDVLSILKQKRPPQQAARQMGDFRQPDDDQTASDQ
jgi:hypothetical protein